MQPEPNLSENNCNVNIFFILLIRSTGQKQPSENTRVSRYIILASTAVFPVFCLFCFPLVTFFFFFVAKKKVFCKCRYTGQKKGLLEHNRFSLWPLVSCLYKQKSCCHCLVSSGEGCTNTGVPRLFSSEEKALQFLLLRGEAPTQIQSLHNVYDCSMPANL